jgi:asparagine synthase (glutamine-hydrolysing)
LDAARLGLVSLPRSIWRAVRDRRHGGQEADPASQFSTLANREALDAVPRLERYVHPDLAGATDLPIGKFNQVQDLLIPFGYYDPYLREAAPELVNALMSQPILELCLAIPSWRLTQGGRGRALARRAFARDMPSEITNRFSKGGMQGHVATVLQRNLPLARSLLLDGQLVRQGILDRSRVEAVLANRSSASGGHLSEVHECIAIEAWIRRASAGTQPTHA